MWIPTQHPAECDSNVALVIGRGAAFHSVTWHSHGTIAGTCAGQGRYNTVRVMYRIVPIQYCNVTYRIVS